jgi:hypothetical protein
MLTKLIKLLVLCSLCLIGTSPSAQAAGPITSTVVCKVAGLYVLPANHGEKIVKFVNRYDYVVPPPSRGSAAADAAEQKLHEACYMKSKWNQRNKMYMFPYTVQRGGPLKQRVTAVACFESGGGFVHTSTIVPKSDFTVQMTERKPASDPFIKRFC